jgi:hypothetical protein
MTVDRQYGRIIFECDRCSDPYETPDRHFDKAIARIKDEGWLVTKDGEMWVHICPNCIDLKLPEGRER